MLTIFFFSFAHLQSSSLIGQNIWLNPGREKKNAEISAFLGVMLRYEKKKKLKL